MYFENLLDAVFGVREVFHVVECEICGFDEIYYEDAETKKLVGRACLECNFVQKFDF